MVHLQEADLLFTPAEVLACHFSLPHCLATPKQVWKQAESMQQDDWFMQAQLEFSAEDEEVDIVPNFQVQDPVHDDMLTIAAVRFGRCPDAPGPSAPGLRKVKLWMRVEAGDLRAVQAKPGDASAAVDGADVAQAEEVPHKPT